MAAQATVHSVTNFDTMLLIPILASAIGTVILWRWLLPLSLRDLQVAFEIDDDEYEVHRLTRSKRESRSLLNQRNVSIGVLAYLSAMSGVLLIIAELLIQPGVYFEPVVVLTGLLIGFPILLSPIVTLYAQFSGGKEQKLHRKLTGQFFGYAGTITIVAAGVIGTLWYGHSLATGSALTDFGQIGRPRDSEIMFQWIGHALMVFMAPTILAYGRIMGTSWNTLFISKWRTMKGWRTPIDPDRPSFMRRLISMALFVFLGTMPLTAVNAAVTLIHVVYNQPENTDRLLDLGGILGLSIYETVEGHPILEQLISLKTLEVVLASYLMMNVAIVGLAFIFELTRNLFLGGQTFGAVGGVILAQPRDIRSERTVQGRILFFGLAGFSGYTVLLLVLQVYKEFRLLMPYGDKLSESLLLQETWQFIAAGQAIFMLTWLLSISRFGRLRQIKFDLSPDERREGVIMAGGGDWMRRHIERSARDQDLAALRVFQTENIDGDRALVSLERGRAKMIESALRGLWPRAIEEGRKVLAQQGGDDDEARMIIACGHIACRRLDAAKEALHGMEQSEGYDEPELISFVAEWLDPWHGRVDDDDLYDWENISTVDLLREMQGRLQTWDPSTEIGTTHNDRLSLYAQLSSVAQLRAQRRSDEALDLAVQMVRKHSYSTLARIATALCLIDIGEWFDALDIFQELNDIRPEDPRIKALATILGYEQDEDELEIVLVNGSQKQKARWIDEAPVNPYAALQVKGGMDEALNANVLSIGHEAIERGMPPAYTHPWIVHLVNWGILTPLWFVLAWLAYQQTGEDLVLSAIVFANLVAGHFFVRRLRRQQRRVIRHRDQKAMTAYARRLKSYKISGSPDRQPIGNHLLLSGLLLTVNGNVYDIGFPGWMVIRGRNERERPFRNRVRSRMRELKSNKLARTKPLPPLWWTKRPKPIDDSKRTLERLIGPAAYRGFNRRQLAQDEGTPLTTGRVRERKFVMDTAPESRGIPTYNLADTEEPAPKRGIGRTAPSRPRTQRRPADLDDEITADDLLD